MCCKRCIEHTWLSRVKKQMTLSPTRGRTRWKHGENCRNCDPTTSGKKRKLLRTIISPGKCSLLELHAGFERWESYLSQNEKKLKEKLGGIKIVGLEALAPEEPEKHVILNTNGLRTFEDARLEIVTYVEAKFRLRIRDSKPRDTVTRGQSNPMDCSPGNWRGLSLIEVDNKYVEYKSPVC